MQTPALALEKLLKKAVKPTRTSKEILFLQYSGPLEEKNSIFFHLKPTEFPTFLGNWTGPSHSYKVETKGNKGRKTERKQNNYHPTRKIYTS